MNYILQLNSFYDLLQSNNISSSAQLLYYTLLQVNNTCGWITWFQRTNLNLSGLMRISEKTLMSARNELKQLGVIDFVVSKKKNEITKYKIIDCKIDGTNSSLFSSPNAVHSPVYSPVQPPDIYKHKSKDNYINNNTTSREDDFDPGEAIKKYDAIIAKAKGSVK